MLSPKRVKFRKMFKGRTRGLATRGAEISFGHYGLQALEPGWITNRQIEAARVALTRHIKRGGRSEEHTSELQSQSNLVCRLLLEKKKKTGNCYTLSPFSQNLPLSDLLCPTALLL